ncbi:MAG: hypothetical protein ABL921_07365, partial [Pirellula sp.]
MILDSNANTSLQGLLSQWDFRANFERCRESAIDINESYDALMGIASDATLAQARLERSTWAKAAIS